MLNIRNQLKWVTSYERKMEMLLAINVNSDITTSMVLMITRNNKKYVFTLLQEKNLILSNICKEFQNPKYWAT